MDYYHPTAADYAASDARSAQNKVDKLEARVAKLENDVRKLDFLVTGKAPQRIRR